MPRRIILALEGGPRKSRDHPTGLDELTVEGSHLIGAPGESPPHGDLRDEHPVATAECYRCLSNDLGLLPPERAPSDPSHVSLKAFQDLAHQVRALTGIVRTIIPLGAPPYDPTTAATRAARSGPPCLSLFQAKAPCLPDRLLAHG